MRGNSEISLVKKEGGADEMKSERNPSGSGRQGKWEETDDDREIQWSGGTGNSGLASLSSPLLLPVTQLPVKLVCLSRRVRVGGKKRAIESKTVEQTVDLEWTRGERERRRDRRADKECRVECKRQAENGKTVQGSSVSTC